MQSLLGPPSRRFSLRRRSLADKNDRRATRISRRFETTDLHADDLGVAHSVNAASFEALEKGDISSASHGADSMDRRGRRLYARRILRRSRPASHDYQRVGNVSMG